MEYIYSVLSIVGIYLILSQSFNLTFGMGRLLNLSHTAVFALGAYTTAILTMSYGCSFWLCLVCSMFLGGVFAFIIGGISLRLSEEYFIIGTLAFNSLVTAVIINWQSLTRGVLGISGIPRPEIWGIDFYEVKNYLLLVLIFTILCQGILWFLFKTPYARRLRAQAESEYGALSLGIYTTRVRGLSFFISSLFAALAGTLFAYYLQIVEPNSFSIEQMIFVFTVVVAGGPGSFWGVTIMALVLVSLPELLRFVGIPDSILGPMRQMINALILFSVVYINRYTLFPQQRRI